MIIFRIINWTACLVLRFVSWAANGLHFRLRSGPRPRLWAASNEELLIEVRKRGLLKKKAKKSASPNVVAMLTNVDTVEESQQIDDAVATTAKLKNISMTAAHAAVQAAVWNMRQEKRKTDNASEIVIAAMQYA